MALKNWYEDFSANDCLEGHVTWNDMTNYIRHSACTIFTIYKTCPSTDAHYQFKGDHDIWIHNGVAMDRAIFIKDDETYIGHGAGDNIGAGTNNTLIGHDAGNAMTTQNNCVFLGYEAGMNNTQHDMLGIGYKALRNNTGLNNIGIGAKALTLCTGNNNIGIGYFSLQNNLAGNHNMGIGGSTLEVNTTGIKNICIGYKALTANNGDYNTGIGHKAGELANRSGCVYIGHEAGQNNATANALYINNSNSAFPLLYGEFANDKLKIGDNNAHWNFSFSQVGTLSTIEGRDITGDVLKLKGSAADNFPYWYIHGGASIMGVLETTNKHFHLAYGAGFTDFFDVTCTAANQTQVAGGDNTGADLTVIANLTDAYPKIKLNGLGYLNLYHNTDKAIYLYEETTNYGQFYRDTDFVIGSGQTNQHIYLKPNGGGLVKFGTEQTNAGSDRGELIPIKTSAGTTVYLKTYDLV